MKKNNIQNNLKSSSSLERDRSHPSKLSQVEFLSCDTYKNHSRENNDLLAVRKFEISQDLRNNLQCKKSKIDSKSIILEKKCFEDSRRNRDKSAQWVPAGFDSCSRSPKNENLDQKKNHYSGNFDSLFNLNTSSKFLHRSPKISNRNNSSSIDSTTRNFKSLENFLINKPEISMRDCGAKQEFNLFKTDK